MVFMKLSTEIVNFIVPVSGIRPRVGPVWPYSENVLNVRKSSQISLQWEIN